MYWAVVHGENEEHTSGHLPIPALTHTNNATTPPLNTPPGSPRPQSKVPRAHCSGIPGSERQPGTLLVDFLPFSVIGFQSSAVKDAVCVCVQKGHSVSQMVKLCTESP